MDPQSATPAPAQPAAESPIAPPAAVDTPAVEDTRAPLERMSNEERSNWWKTGEIPSSISGEPAKPAADAAKPAVADEDAPAVDAKGQQIRGADGKFVSKRQHAVNERIRDSVERGIATERERANRLERELADLKRGATPAAAAPKPAAAPEPDGPAEPDFERDFESQVGGTYETYGKAVQAFNRAYHQWTQNTAAHEARKAAATEAQASRTRDAERIVTGHLDREAAFAATTPDYFDKTLALREALDAGLKAGAPLTLPLLESPMSAQLIVHFAEHPDDLTRIGQLGLTNLPAALRELGKLEAKYESAGASPAAPAAPLKKTLSTAPEPPTMLGTRSAEPANQKDAALKRKDVSAYMREADREDLATVRR